MPRCPQCGKESKTLYLTSSGVCVECNRLNYQRKEAGEEPVSAPTFQESFETKYLNYVKAANILNISLDGLSSDEIHKLVTIRIAKLLQTLFYLLIIVLVVIPILSIIF